MDLISFIIGVITGFISNWLYDKYKAYKKGKKPFIETRISGGMIHFHGQIENSTMSQNSITKVYKSIE